MLGNGKKNIGYDLSYYTNNLYPAFAFVSTFRTTTPGESITLPYEVAGTYSGTINWGDGTTSVNSYANRTHVYQFSGYHQIIIQGETTGWNFLSGSSLSKDNIISIDQWGTLRLGNAGLNFYNCININLSNVIGVLNTTGTTTFYALFYYCSSLTSVKNINLWNTVNIGDMGLMFYLCSNFNQSLSFNTSSVVAMNNMFQGCTSFNQELNFNTVNVTNMEFMFFNCPAFNTEFYFSSTANVVYMNNMFFNCGAFNQELNFNTGNVQNMAGMFTNCFAFNQDISSWDVSNVASFTDFMAGKTFSDYDSFYLADIYSNWSVLAVQPNLNINFGTIKFQSYGLAGKLVLLSIPNLWTITDGGAI